MEVKRMSDRYKRVAEGRGRDTGKTMREDGR